MRLRHDGGSDGPCFRLKLCRRFAHLLQGCEAARGSYPRIQRALACLRDALADELRLAPAELAAFERVPGRKRGYAATGATPKKTLMKLKLITQKMLLQNSQKLKYYLLSELALPVL